MRLRGETYNFEIRVQVLNLLRLTQNQLMKSIIRCGSRRLDLKHLVARLIVRECRWSDLLRDEIANNLKKGYRCSAANVD